jgi:ribosome maturation factor RimP
MCSSRAFQVWKEPVILACKHSGDPPGLSAWFLRATIRAFAVELNWADSSSPFFLLDRVFRFPERPSAGALHSQGFEAVTMNWQAAVERTVTGMGYELVDVERSAGGLLRAYIDRLPGQAYETGPGEVVTVDDCELVTRQLQYALEVEAVDYARLEVSSPGLDRPLKSVADYQRFAGNEVEVTLREAFQNRKKWRGTLQQRADGGWCLVLPPVLPQVKPGAKVGKKAAAAAAAQPEQAFEFALDEVREARLVPVVDFKGRRRTGAEPQETDGGQD